MTFERPEYLTLILIMVSVGIFSAVAAHAKKNRILRALGSVELIGSFSNLDIGARNKATVLYLSILILLILAAAGPQISTPKQMRKGSVDLLVVLDVSRSMSAEDFGYGTRLQAAKEMIKRLTEKLNGNRMALVTFAGSPFEQAPLTNDYKAIRFVIDEWVGINSVRKAGSDIISALETAVNVLDRSDRNNKLMLLLSDGGGDIDPGRAPAVYQSIRERKIKFVAAGIGSRKGVYLKKSEHDSSMVLTALDEENLKKIAEACGGAYIKGSADPTRVSADILDKRLIGNEAFEGRQSLYYIPLLLAVLAFGMAFRL